MATLRIAQGLLLALLGMGAMAPAAQAAYTKIAAGSHTCAITDQGMLECWGDNGLGQLGNGIFESRAEPTAVPGLTGVTSVSTGYIHTCAIAAGKLYCWGYNGSGQLGDGTKGNRSLPTLVAGVLANVNVEAVSAGDSHTCAIAGGRAYCWGNNYSGQLGDGTAEERLLPVAVGGDLAARDVSELAVGGEHTCAIAEGTLYCWGRNDTGQLGDGTVFERELPAPVGGVFGGATATAVGVGGYHTCALTGQRAYCWGRNSEGQLGDATTTQRLSPVLVKGALTDADVTALAIGSVHGCAISSGQAYCWGGNGYGELGRGDTSSFHSYPLGVGIPLAGVSVSTLSAGQVHSCALVEGTAYCWGGNWGGRLGIGRFTYQPTPAPISEMSGTVVSRAGYGHTCATENGTLHCWGDNAIGQVGDGSSSNRSVPVNVPLLPAGGIVNFATGMTHSCAVAADGAVYCWGSNLEGQLGDGSWVSKPTPVQVQGFPAGTQASSVTTGGWHACAVTSAGAYCWGEGSVGQLGNGAFGNVSTPQPVTPPPGATWQQMDAGDLHTCAVDSAGKAWCWGYGAEGELGNGTLDSSDAPVAVLGIPTADPVTLVSAGMRHSCAVTTSPRFE